MVSESLRLHYMAFRVWSRDPGACPIHHDGTWVTLYELQGGSHSVDLGRLNLDSRPCSVAFPQLQGVLFSCQQSSFLVPVDFNTLFLSHKLPTCPRVTGVRVEIPQWSPVEDVTPNSHPPSTPNKSKMDGPLFFSQGMSYRCSKANDMYHF